MRLIDSYALAPGQCSHCGGQNLPALDLERDVLDEETGRVLRFYLCSSCATEAGQNVGMLTEHSIKRLKADNKRLKAKLEAANAELDDIGDRIMAALVRTDLDDDEESAA